MADTHRFTAQLEAARAGGATVLVPERMPPLGLSKMFTVTLPEKFAVFPTLSCTVTTTPVALLMGAPTAVVVGWTVKAS